MYAQVSELPFCDLPHPGEAVRALFDAKTTEGPWANMCVAHMSQYGVGLGTGRGQVLVRWDPE